MTNVALIRAEKGADTPAAEFHARVDALLPVIEQQADEAERIGHLTDDVVDALRKSGIYTMLFPKAVGGPELSPFDAMQIVERLSYAHASAGWCTIVNNMEGMTMAIYIEDPGIAEVFRNGVDITIAGNGVPRGFARPVDGGYMISGHWAYGSAITHAEWIHTGCFVTDPSGKEMLIQPNGQPKVVITHHPRSTIKLLGNWDVLGLRATGSFDYELAEGPELFVPGYQDVRLRHRRAAPRRHPGHARPSRLERLGPFKLGNRRWPADSRRTRQGGRQRAPTPSANRATARASSFSSPKRRGGSARRMRWSTKPGGASPRPAAAASVHRSTK